MSATAISEGQKTALYQNHHDRGARLVDFAGWQMPLQYTKVIEEHQAVRQAAGLFDISHMGLVLVTGPSTEAVLIELNKLVPQDLTKLYACKAIYTQFLNDAGGILDDIIIYQLPESLSQPELSKHFDTVHQVLIICNASNTPADMDWMRTHLPSDFKITLASEQFGLLALQGPQFASVLEKLGVPQDKLPKRFCVSEAVLSSATNTPVLLARTGYTGEDGVEIIINSSQINALWDTLLKTGHPLGLLPVGLAARDTLRLEAAYPLHGHDISPTDTPLEAGLGWSVKLGKEADFIGKSALVKQKEQGLPKQFYCFKILKKTIARQHDAILINGESAGEVTSGSISPTLNEPIAMGYIESRFPLKTGDTLQISIRNQPVDAVIVDRPFYKAV